VKPLENDGKTSVFLHPSHVIGTPLQFDGRMIVLSDTAFHAAEGDPANLKLCQRGEWEDRILVETVLSMLTLVCHFKKVMHRVWTYFHARLAFTIKNARGTPPFRAGRKGRGPAGATAEPSGGVEAPAFRPGRTSTAAFNILVQWYGLQPNASGFVPLSIAEFSL
jgi:hypothetical protein